MMTRQYSRFDSAQKREQNAIEHVSGKSLFTQSISFIHLT